MIKITEKKDEKLGFETDMNVSLANAIRRSVNEIPILAIDFLDITKNDSALYDEIIAHRMGLVPLKDEGLKMREDCGCGKEEGCGKCTVKFKLSEKGPCVVYSDQLSPKGNSIYKMPITILDKDQEIEFVATAKMGKGIEHSKFVPGLAVYRYKEDKDINEVEKDDENFSKILEDAEKEKGELSFFIESWGQIKAKEIFVKAVEALEENLEQLKKSLK